MSAFADWALSSPLSRLPRLPTSSESWAGSESPCDEASLTPPVSADRSPSVASSMFSALMSSVPAGSVSGSAVLLTVLPGSRSPLRPPSVTESRAFWSGSGMSATSESMVTELSVDQ